MTPFLKQLIDIMYDKAQQMYTNAISYRNKVEIEQEPVLMQTIDTDFESVHESVESGESVESVESGESVEYNINQGRSTELGQSELDHKTIEKLNKLMKDSCFHEYLHSELQELINKKTIFKSEGFLQNLIFVHSEIRDKYTFKAVNITYKNGIFITNGYQFVTFEEFWNHV